jgi:hypothetical protein
MRKVPTCNAAILTATVIFAGASVTVAHAAGLQAELRSAAAMGPDGNLYVGFLKSGNVKRIVPLAAVE